MSPYPNVLKFCLCEINTWIEVSLKIYYNVFFSSIHAKPHSHYAKKGPYENTLYKDTRRKISPKIHHPKETAQKETQSFPALLFYTPQSHAATETGFYKRQYPVSRNCCSFRQKCNRTKLYDTSSVNYQWAKATAHSGWHFLIPPKIFHWFSRSLLKYFRL